MKFFPPEGDQTAHVALTSGHTAVITTAGTELDERFYREAIKQGCRPDGMPEGVITHRPHTARNALAFAEQGNCNLNAYRDWWLSLGTRQQGRYPEPFHLDPLPAPQPVIPKVNKAKRDRLASKRQEREDALKTLLTTIVKTGEGKDSLDKSEEAKVELAQDELIEAARRYETDRMPIVDQNGERYRPAGIADTRKHLSKFDKQLGNTLDLLDPFPLDAFRLFRREYDGQIQTVIEELRRMKVATGIALTKAKAVPDKALDASLRVLALDVALVFRDILGRRPSFTSSTEININGSRGGGDYDRVLRLTLALVGIRLTDTKPLLRAAKQLLNDPELPHKLPRK